MPPIGLPLWDIQLSGIEMFTLPDIYKLLADVSDIKPEQAKPSSDLFAELGIDGDDFFELEIEFSKRFSVDMSPYRWYFYHGEEGGPSIGRLLFKPPYCRVRRMPITPELLLASANAHQWSLAYPVHQLPPHRLDLLFDQISLGIIGMVVLVFVGWRWLYS